MKITLKGIEKAEGMVIRVVEDGIEVDCTRVTGVPEDHLSWRYQKPIDVSPPEARGRAASGG